MTSAAIRDSGLALAQLSIPNSSVTQKRSDAQMGIREFEVLRADLDMVAPADAAALAEPLVELYRGASTSGDHLRLPQLTRHDGPALQAAVGRILDTDTTSAGGSRETVIKEERMRRVLTALQGVVATIQRQANMSSRY